MASFGEREFEVALREILTSLGINIRKEQKEGLKQLVFGGDLLAVLPTGFGKSLIFQLLVLVLEMLTKQKCCVVVVCPLKCIIEDQVKEAENLGLKAQAVSTVELSEDGLSTVQLLFGSAEELLHEKFLACLKHGNFSNSVKAVIVDESHTIETWTGQRNTKGTTVKPFRESFGKLSSLRSFCRPGTPIGALTGTADNITQSNICKSLCLKGDCLKIYVSPNRANLRFTVKKVPKNAQHKELLWLVEMAKEHGAATPKTLIFCNTMNEIASVTNYLIYKLGNSRYDPIENKIPDNSILGIFHSNSWSTNKERLMSAMKGNGKKRIIIATSALCMGVNFPDIRYIINWGPARSILDQHQQAGRAGRDGELSHVVILYHGQQIGPCEREVKEFVRAAGCLRVAAYISLDPDIEPSQPAHDCCSFCSVNCQCLGRSCGAEKLPFNKVTKDENTSTEPRRKRTVTDQDREDVREALIEVRDSLNQQVLLDHCSGHGFADTLIEEVVEQCHEIFSLEYIVSQFSVFSLQHALAIFEVINEMFLDIPLNEETLSVVSSAAQHQSFSLLDDMQFTDELFEGDNNND